MSNEIASTPYSFLVPDVVYREAFTYLIILTLPAYKTNKTPAVYVQSQGARLMKNSGQGKANRRH
jgi:hypothetical protein